MCIGGGGEHSVWFCVCVCVCARFSRVTNKFYKIHIEAGDVISVAVMPSENEHTW